MPCVSNVEKCSPRWVTSPGYLLFGDGDLLLLWPQCEKTCLRGFGNNTGADQHAQPRRLISALVIRFLESIICNLATDEISIF